MGTALLFIVAAWALIAITLTLALMLSAKRNFDAR
jgi:hypothetical protein